MPNDQPTDLERVEELFRFLQGTMPEGCRIEPTHIPQLTPDQAWTVIGYLGNQYWQVPDDIERCEVCGDLYDTGSGGSCLDVGDPPYHWCDACEYQEEVLAKIKKHPQAAAEAGYELNDD